MGLFNDNFKHGSIFTVNSDDFPFVNLKDVIAENGHKVLHVQGCFTYEHTKGKVTKKRAVFRLVFLFASKRINIFLQAQSGYPGSRRRRACGSRRRSG